MSSSHSRHSHPLLLKENQKPARLSRVMLGQGADNGERRESFIQGLVHDHPDLIPMEDIEPAFMPLISECREQETSAGYLDNLWATPAGGLIIGECKLVRSPQARREVVAQALDYARAISGWTYETLTTQIAKARKDTCSLRSLVSEDADMDEAQFVDALERRLRVGRFMVLVIGDGIQEGAESLVSYLQLHAGLHIAFALVDLSIWHAPDNPDLFVVPRVPMRTVLIERGVVRVEGADNVRIVPPGSMEMRGSGSPNQTSRPHTLSEEEFYDHLEQCYPGRAASLAAFVESLAVFGVTPEFRRTLVLRWRISPDVLGSLGYIETSGKVWMGEAASVARKLGAAEAGEQYLSDVAAAVGGSVRHYLKQNTNGQIMRADGRVIDIATMLDHQDDWLKAIAELNAAVAAAAERRDT